MAKAKLEPADPTRTIAFQGAPGAYSDLACRRVFPDMATLPCNQFEDAFAAVRDDRARAGDDPDRKFGRRPRRRHPSFDAEFGPAHHRRAFRAGEPSPPGVARCEPRSNPHRQKPCPCVVAVPQNDPRARHRADRRRRHRRGGGRNRRPRRPDRRGHRLRTRRPDLRPRLAQGEHRGRRAQHDAVSDHVARSIAAAARQRLRSRHSCSACATCRRRSTRRSAGSPPTGST